MILSVFFDCIISNFLLHKCIHITFYFFYGLIIPRLKYWLKSHRLDYLELSVMNTININISKNEIYHALLGTCIRKYYYTRKKMY